MKKCVVCQERPDVESLWCRTCWDAWERGPGRSGIATMVDWAAARARRFERKRAKLRMDARLADAAVVERALLDKVERLTAELAASQAEHDATARRYNAALDRLHAEMAELERARDEARVEAARLKRERDEMSRTRADAIAACIRAEAECEQWRDEASIMTECRAEALGDVNAIRHDLASEHEARLHAEHERDEARADAASAQRMALKAMTQRRLISARLHRARALVRHAWSVRDTAARAATVGWRVVGLLQRALHHAENERDEARAWAAKCEAETVRQTARADALERELRAAAAREMPEGTEWARELLASQDEPAAPEPDDCPGVGRCHGAMQWCDSCGDVGRVCDCDCDLHRERAAETENARA